MFKLCKEFVAKYSEVIEGKFKDDTDKIIKVSWCLTDETEDILDADNREHREET